MKVYAVSNCFVVEVFNHFLTIKTIYYNSGFKFGS